MVDVAVVLAGTIVEIATFGWIRTGVVGDQIFKPSRIVLMQAWFVIVDEHGTVPSIGRQSSDVLPLACGSRRRVPYAWN